MVVVCVAGGVFLGWYLVFYLKISWYSVFDLLAGDWIWILFFSDICYFCFKMTVFAIWRQEKAKLRVTFLSLLKKKTIKKTKHMKKKSWEWQRNRSWSHLIPYLCEVRSGDQLLCWHKRTIRNFKEQLNGNETKGYF